MPNNELIARKTIAERIEAFDLAARQLSAGFEMLAQAQETMRTTFGDGQYSPSFNPIEYTTHWSVYKPHTGFDEAKRISTEVKLEWETRIWSYILDQTHIMSRLSEARRKQVNKAITDKQMGPLTVEAVFTLLDSFSQNFGVITKEVIWDAYQALCPEHNKQIVGSQYKPYKSNLPRIGKRVIITNVVRGRGGRYGELFDVEYGSYGRGKIQTIDRAFYLLDGNSMPDNWQCPLELAIQQTRRDDPHGSTEYYDFICYAGNGNLHLTFKRRDLVDEMNRICAGMNLDSGK